MPINTTQESLHLLTGSGIELPLSLLHTPLKRRIDFLSGRYCARYALHLAGCRQYETLPISNARTPVWPPEFIGSISHSSEIAVAIAASKNLATAIGIDTENIITEINRKRIVRLIATERETELGHEQKIAPNLWATLIFSAKESLFKALYPQIGVPFFFDAAIVQQVNIAAKKITLILCRTLSPQYLQGQSIDIFFNYNMQQVLTLCIIDGPDLLPNLAY